MDRLVPSYHNLVTQAGLQVNLVLLTWLTQTHMKAILAGHRTNDPRLFLAYTRCALNSTLLI
jgi:transcription initiation factor TFIID subunit 2